MGLRVISGKFRGKKLYSVPGANTRPTSDRLRESLFNILSFRVQNAHVLDLFAGTGALGIEAMSRGADTCVFIDKYEGALSIINKNITACNIEEQTKTFKWDIRKNLNCLKSEQPTFSLVFMDPPYNTNSIEPTFHNLLESRVLIKDALVVIEHSIRETLPNNISQLQIADQRKYGKTVVSFLNFVI